MLIFNRIANEARSHFMPFQFRLGTNDIQKKLIESGIVHLSCSKANKNGEELDERRARSELNPEKNSKTKFLPEPNRVTFEWILGFVKPTPARSGEQNCTSAQSVISEDLACFFQNLMMLSCKAPLEMCASRLVALSKSGGGVRPIAIGESLFRLLSMLIFKRITNTARTHLSPFQFGIGTIDGASIASLTSDLFFCPISLITS
ncbi:hypothetical protein RCL1_007228 [Eukaryota sp. TZLM3-RCL]